MRCRQKRTVSKDRLEYTRFTILCSSRKTFLLDTVIIGVGFLTKNVLNVVNFHVFLPICCCFKQKNLVFKVISGAIAVSNRNQIISSVSIQFKCKEKYFF